MRILLALILTMVPVLAQQADAPPKAGDQTAQTPAKDATTKPADQTRGARGGAAAANPAPGGRATGFPAASTWDTDSSPDPAGNDPEYRSVVNLGQGLVLDGVDFTIRDPRKRLFDRLDANAFGWGGEPYELAHLNAQKQNIYNLTFDYRNIAFFDAVPSYANPPAPAGFNEQSFDTRRTA